MGVINAFQMFTSAFVLTNGGPMSSTFVYALYLYERAFSRYQLGYSSALAWIMLVMIVGAALVISATSKYWVFYETDIRNLIGTKMDFIDNDYHNPSWEKGILNMKRKWFALLL